MTTSRDLVSFVPERQRRLILDLLLGRLSEEQFFQEFPASRDDASSVGLDMVRRAIQERDAVGVEFGLYLGHRFGVSPSYLDALIELVGANWHERHEDVVDGLAKLKAPASIDALYQAALAEHSYRDYDEAHSLEVKAVRALAAIHTGKAIERLGELLRHANSTVQSETRAQLTKIVSNADSEVLRTAAREALLSDAPNR
jgi:hypothetical protein